MTRKDELASEFLKSLTSNFVISPWDKFIYNVFLLLAGARACALKLGIKFLALDKVRDEEVVDARLKGLISRSWFLL